jgi:hypothetical protein
MAIHEKLTRISKHELQQVGWSKATELVTVARKDGERFDCEYKSQLAVGEGAGNSSIDAKSSRLCTNRKNCSYAEIQLTTDA